MILSSMKLLIHLILIKLCFSVINSHPHYSTRLNNQFPFNFNHPAIQKTSCLNVSTINLTDLGNGKDQVLDAIDAHNLDQQEGIKNQVILNSIHPSNATYMDADSQAKAKGDYLLLDEPEVENGIFRSKRRIHIVKTIETAVFIDKHLVERFFGKLDKLKDFVITIISKVQLIFNYSSMRTRIKIVLVKYEILDKDAPDTAEGNVEEYLNNFCLWQRKQKFKNWIDNWDYAILLTGINLYGVKENGAKNNKVIGLSWRDGMCTLRYSCAINQVKSFEAAFIIAHEMGHSMGMAHDGDDNDCNPHEFIMSFKTGPGKVKWSACSNKYIEKFMRMGRGRCLDDIATPSQELDFSRTGRLPGEIYPAERQCKEALGPKFFPFLSNKKPYENICRELWCSNAIRIEQTHPALEGTSCGKFGQRCVQGECTVNLEIDTIDLEDKNSNSNFIEVYNQSDINQQNKKWFVGTQDDHVNQDEKNNKTSQYDVKIRPSKVKFNPKLNETIHYETKGLAFRFFELIKKLANQIKIFSLLQHY